MNLQEPPAAASKVMMLADTDSGSMSQCLEILHSEQAVGIEEVLFLN